MSGVHALIDADILVYRCGFAAEKNKYILTSLNNPIRHEFQYKKELDAFVKDNGLDMDQFIVEKQKNVEPLGFALQNVKTVIVAIMDRLGAADYTMYLTGGINFRDAIAITKPYKGNRDPDHKPIYYQEIRDYLVDTWKAVVTDGIEADDVIADVARMPAGCGNPLVIVSTDKDLDQIAGDHYNWVKDEVYHVDAYTASRNMWLRVLTGDPTDNIQGIPGMGPKKAEKYLDAFDPAEWAQAILHMFEDTYGMDMGKQVFYEHVRLVKLGAPQKQEENEVLTDAEYRAIGT